MGNWLTREQAKELLTVPDRSTLKGKRDYVILALLVGCALRRTELAELELSIIQLRENRWVVADLEGKGRLIRTVAVPVWVRKGIEVWQEAAGIDKGCCGRQGLQAGGDAQRLAIWSVVEQAAKQVGIERFGATIYAAPAPSSAGKRRRSGTDQVPAQALLHPAKGLIRQLR